jgi:uncharacterized membrane protein YqgA involved in biofilm formation
MTGTLINTIAILIGSTLGLRLGKLFPERVQRTVMAALGLFTAAIGLQMFLKTENPIVVLCGLLAGCLIGEWWRIEDKLTGLGGWLEKRFANSNGTQTSGNRFVRGFVTSSLVFCVGPMAIIGSIQDGLTGDFRLLAIKSVLDFFASIAFASSLGLGVLFSAFIILLYQGTLSLLAAQAQFFLSTPMTNEMIAAGGVILFGLAVSSLLEIKPIRIGNFLPGLVTTPLIVAILTLMR